MSIPFDAESKRLEYLQQLQEGSLSALRELGAVPRTSGVTRPLSSPASGLSIIDTLSNEVARGAVAEGPRFLDRNSTDAASTYRNTRYTYFANNYGARPYAYNETTGRRVRAGEKPTGKVRVGVNFDMDSPDAKKQWDAVFGNAISFDAVRAGDVSINQPQIQALFDATVRTQESAIDTHLADTPVVLTENQRLSLLDIATSSPALFDQVIEKTKAGDTAGAAAAVLADGPVTPNSSSRRYTQAASYVGLSNTPKQLPDFPTYQKNVDAGAFLIARSNHGAPAIQGMHPELQTRLTALFKDAPPGIRDGLTVISGYRSEAEQTVLWNAALKKYGSADEARKWVAPPGHSNHNNGTAADVGWKGSGLGDAPKEVIDYLHQNAAKYGLSFPLSNENWHIELGSARGQEVAMNLDGHRLSTNIEDRRALPSVVDPAKTPQNTMFAPFRYDQDGNPLPPPVDDTGKPLRMIT